MNYLILLVSINLWSFNTLPNDVDNASLFTASTEIAVTVYNTPLSTKMVTNHKMNIVPGIPYWSAGKQKDNFEYVNCGTCQTRLGYKHKGPLGECTPGSDGDPVTQF